MYSTEIKNFDNIKVKAGVGAIILDSEKRILFEKRRDNGMWGLIGGGIKSGETVRQALKREAKEESGFDIEISELIGVYSKPSDGRIVTYPDNGDVVQLVDIIFVANIVSGKMRLSNESLKLEFFGYDNLPKDIVPPAVKPLQDYFAQKRNMIR